MENKKIFLNDLNVLQNLTKRNLKIFLKDKAAVFFSLLAPLIVFMLYILFLSDIQINSVMSMFPKGINVAEKSVKAFVNSWMVTGVMGTACITVSLGATTVMVQDRQKLLINDFLSSPVKKWVIIASYFTYNFIVTFGICFIVLLINLIYLAGTGAWFLTAGNFFEAIGIMIVSILSATLINTFFVSFLKSEATLSALSGMFSAAIGFLIGAYMPMYIMPKGVQYFSALLPGSHSAALFRNVLMTGSLDNLTNGLLPQYKTSLAKAFSMNVNFFGIDVGKDVMYLVLAISILLFIILNLVFAFNKDKFFIVNHKQKKRGKKVEK